AIRTLRGCRRMTDFDPIRTSDRFRTIQVGPKDLPVVAVTGYNLQEADPLSFSGVAARREGSPHGQCGAARVHRFSRRRGDGILRFMAARGTRAAGCAAGDRIPSPDIA